MLSVEQQGFPGRSSTAATNFDYLDDARKAELREFFGWFGRLEATPTAVA